MFYGLLHALPFPALPTGGKQQQQEAVRLYVTHTHDLYMESNRGRCPAAENAFAHRLRAAGEDFSGTAGRGPPRTTTGHRAFKSFQLGCVNWRASSTQQQQQQQQQQATPSRAADATPPSSLARGKSSTTTNAGGQTNRANQSINRRGMFAGERDRA